jgi:hypothetical protein
MSFDVEGARAAGYNEAEIAEVLAARHNFDLAAARKHYSDGEVIAQLAGKAVIPGGAVAPKRAKSRGVIESAAGVVDAAATIGTATVGAPIGAMVGWLGGLVDELASNKGGTKEDRNKRLEKAVADGIKAGVWMPRTEAGAGNVEAVADVAKNLIPLTGIAGVGGAPAAASLGALSKIAGAAANSGRASLAHRMAQSAAPAAAPEAAAIPAAATIETVSKLATTAKRAAEPGIGSNAARQVLAGEAAPDPKITGAASRIGVSDLMQPDYVTKTPTYRKLSGIVKSSLPTGEAATAEARNLQEFATRASKLVNDLKGDTDLSAVDRGVKTLLTDKHLIAATDEELHWATVRASIDETAKVSSPQTSKLLSRMVQVLGGPENAARATPSAEAKSFLRPILNGEAVTYGYLDLTRKQVGQALGKAKGPFSNMETGDLGRMYAALSDDVEAAARSIGAPGTEKALALAKEATRVKKDLEANLATLFGDALQRSFVGGGDISLPGAFNAASKGDPSKVIRLMKHIPPEMRESVSVSGLATYFRASASGKDFDFTHYAKAYEGLRRNREAYAAAMQHVPLSSRKQLEALYRVSRGVSDSMATRIKTVQLNTVVSEIVGTDGLMGTLYETARRSGSTMAAEAFSSAAGIPGAGLSAGIASALSKTKTPPLQAVDKLIASPEFVALAAAKLPKERAAAVNRVASSKAFAQFVQAVGRPSKITADPPGWIVEAMRPQLAAPVQQQQTIH